MDCCEGEVNFIVCQGPCRRQTCQTCTVEHYASFADLVCKTCNFAECIRKAIAEERVANVKVDDEMVDPKGDQG